MKVSFESPTEKFFSKGRNFLALCSTRFQLVQKFQKVSQVVPLWFSLISRSFKLLKLTKKFKFWHARRKNLAKRLKIVAHAKIFSHLVRKIFPSISKSDKRKNYFQKHVLKVFSWIGGKQLWHQSSKTFVGKVGIFSFKSWKRSTIQVYCFKRKPSAVSLCKEQRNRRSMAEIDGKRLTLKVFEE